MNISDLKWPIDSWDFLIGCSYTSPGCTNCYGKEKAAWHANKYVSSPYRKVLQKHDGKYVAWNGEYAHVVGKFLAPLNQVRPRMILTNSTGDMFHPSVPHHMIAAAFGVMAAATRHTFLIVTKYPHRAKDFFDRALEDDRTRNPGIEATPGRLHCIHEALVYEMTYSGKEDFHTKWCPEIKGPWPLPNVWLGVSVENQVAANDRIPHLLQCPATVRFVCYEPALSPIQLDVLDYGSFASLSGLTGDISMAGRGTSPGMEFSKYPGLDWVVISGESGKQARPHELSWARSIVRQCRAADVPVHIKQLGSDVIETGAPDGSHDALDMQMQGAGFSRIHTLKLTGRGEHMSEWPVDLRIQEWPSQAQHHINQVMARQELLRSAETETR